MRQQLQVEYNVQAANKRMIYWDYVIHGHSCFNSISIKFSDIFLPPCHRCRALLDKSHARMKTRSICVGFLPCRISSLIPLPIILPPFFAILKARFFIPVVISKLRRLNFFCILFRVCGRL